MKKGVVVAGGNGIGDASNQLFCPAGLWVVHYTDAETGYAEEELFVCDEANNRIQRFKLNDDKRSHGIAFPNAQKDRTLGSTVIGNLVAGGGSNELYHPLGLWFNVPKHEFSQNKVACDFH